MNGGGDYISMSLHVAQCMHHGFDVFVGGIGISIGEDRERKTGDGERLKGVQGGAHMPHRWDRI